MQSSLPGRNTVLIVQVLAPPQVDDSPVELQTRRPTLDRNKVAITARKIA
ncbi:hypothetical protein HC028_05215 [Planosporangium flavigriseum]|nr:hypothetical protein [Planosporangium flavigriseum]NJC63909.1 hypothetical protein [Planosporangium flavigriseum]